MRICMMRRWPRLVALVTFLTPGLALANLPVPWDDSVRADISMYRDDPEIGLALGFNIVVAISLTVAFVLFGVWFIRSKTLVARISAGLLTVSLAAPVLISWLVGVVFLLDFATTTRPPPSGRPTFEEVVRTMNMESPDPPAPPPDQTQQEQPRRHQGTRAVSGR